MQRSETRIATQSSLVYTITQLCFTQTAFIQSTCLFYLFKHLPLKNSLHTHTPDIIIGTLMSFRLFSFNLLHIISCIIISPFRRKDELSVWQQDCFLSWLHAGMWTNTVKSQEKNRDTQTQPHKKCDG